MEWSQQTAKTARVMVMSFSNIVSLFCVLFIFVVRVHAGKTNETEMVRFEAAAIPFTDTNRISRGLEPFFYASKSDLKRNAGSIDSKGNVIRGGAPCRYLDCSTFASPVIHYFQNQNFDNFDASIQTKWGDEIAASYNLPFAYRASLELALRDQIAGRIPTGIMFFDMRDESGKKKGKDGLGHVGFAIIESKRGTNEITQVHLSGMKSVVGRKEGGLVWNTKFAEFLKSSTYGNDASARTNSIITLYRMELPKRELTGR